MGNILSTQEQPNKNIIDDFVLIDEEKEKNVIIYRDYTSKSHVISSLYFAPGKIYSNFRETFLKPITYFIYNRYLKIPGGRGWCFPKKYLKDVLKFLNYEKIKYKIIDYNMLNDILKI